MNSQMPKARPLLVHLLHYDGPGGGPRCVMELIQMLGDEFDQAVISGGDGSLAAFCRERTIPFHNVGWHRVAGIVPAVVKLFLLLRKLRPAVIVTQGQWAGLFGAPTALAARVPAIVHVVQYTFLYVNWDLWRCIRNHCIERLTCLASDRVVVLSPGSRYQYLLRGWPDESKLVLIPNSFDPAREPPPERSRAIREKHNWNPAECNVVSVGRLADQKRPDWLLRSWALIERENLPARLWIIGGGPEEKKLRDLGAQFGLRTCEFLGPQADGIDYVAAADLVAMTSLYEMHAVLPLEAMGCGRAIVASNVDGVGSSIRDGVDGLLVAPGDIEGFAAALRELILNPARREEMGRHGRERVREFLPEKIRAAYRRLFAKISAVAP
jgi:glycosyltransferase involved in cell wall biosynthesis